MLFIDDEESEPFPANILAEELVRSDDNIDRSTLKSFEDAFLFR